MPRMIGTFSKVALFVSAIALMMNTAMAHEGHGHPEHTTGASHYVVNASHAIPIVLGAALILAGTIVLYRLMQPRSNSGK